MALVMGEKPVQVDSSDAKNEKWVSHYSNMQHILLVGEGDFSFSSCLATGFGTANRMIATSLDSKTDLEKNYGNDAKINTSNLINRDALVYHEFDACNMATKHATPLCSIEHTFFDRIIFNFPHAGFSDSKTDHSIMIQKHRELLRLFFANAICMLLPGGEVHVSNKHDDEWKLEEQAQMAGLALVGCIPFVFEAFPGYRTRRGADKEAGRRFPLGKASTYVFAARNMELPMCVLNTKNECEVLNFVGTWKSVLPEIVDLKAKLVQRGQASEKTSLMHILADEVERLKKLSCELSNRKVVKFKMLNSVLKEVKLCLLQDTSSLSLLPSLGTTSKLPKCLRVCEFCGASLRERRRERQSKNSEETVR